MYLFHVRGVGEAKRNDRDIFADEMWVNTIFFLSTCVSYIFLNNYLKIHYSGP
jgi:hypothetical protein